MTDLYARHIARPSARETGRRLLILACAALAILAWRAVYPHAVTLLAGWNFGNPRAVPLVYHAAWMHFPDRLAAPEERTRQHFEQGDYRFRGSTNTGRTATLQLATRDNRLELYDARFARLATITATFGGLSPDDRDGDGNLEGAFMQWHYTGPRGAGWLAVAIVRLVGEQNQLLAAYRVPMGPAGGVSTLPCWTDLDRDGRHELEVLNATYRARRFGSTFTSGPKFRFLAPGQLVLEGTLPAGSQHWLSEPGAPVYFDARDDLAEVLTRLQWRE